MITRRLDWGALLLLGACTPPMRYFENTVHPERDFEMDKYDCGTTAQARATMAYPGNSYLEIYMRSVLASTEIVRCLESRGWREVIEARATVAMQDDAPAHLPKKKTRSSETVAPKYIAPKSHIRNAPVIVMASHDGALRATAVVLRQQEGTITVDDATSTVTTSEHLVTEKDGLRYADCGMLGTQRWPAEAAVIKGTVRPIGQGQTSVYVTVTWVPYPERNATCVSTGDKENELQVMIKREAERR